MSDALPHVMIDLETMGLKPNSAVVAIGAVKFIPFAEPGLFVSTFETTISLDDCLNAGLTVDGSTVEWWLRQSEDARSSLKFENGLYAGLLQFKEWFGAASLPMWGNGSSFDCVVLGSAFDACGIERPWKYWHEMCYRTMKSAFRSVPRIAPTVAHDALSDAVAQTTHLQTIFHLHGERDAGGLHGKEAQVRHSDQEGS